MTFSLSATFAKDGFSLTDGNNTFTAIAKDSYGRRDTNVVTSWLPASASYVYDSSGNLLSDGKRGFVYDDENQLTRVTVTNAWKSEFVYDGKMRRRIRREYAWQSGAWSLGSEVHYVYDGNLVIQERDASNLPLVAYTRGRDLSGTFEGAGGIGGLMARTDLSTLNTQPSTSHAFYHCDGNGNITCLVNTNQAVVAKYLYDPYGTILSQSGPLADANLYRFSSKEFHVASGLVYYLYRFYEPSLQRWVNRDPLGEEGFEHLRHAGPYRMAVDPNEYGFIDNSPLNFTDPLGLKKLTIDDCNKFRQSALDDLRVLASEEGKACTYRGILGVVGGGAIMATGGGAGLGLGLGTLFGGGFLATDIYSAGHFVGSNLERTQQINRLYNLCIERVTQHST